MLFDINTMAAKPRYNLLTSLIVPRPIAWVTTTNRAGRVNAAPFSFFNLMSGTPPIVVLGIGTRAGYPKDTSRNIIETGEFVVNTVTVDHLEAMNITAIDFEPDVNEIAEAGLDTIPSHQVAPPRIAGSPAALECRFRHSIAIGHNRDLFIGEIVYAYVDDDAILDPDRGHVDGTHLDVVGRMHGGGFYTATAPFKLDRITAEEKPRHLSSDIQKSGSLR